MKIKPLYTIGEVAEILRLSTETVRNLVVDGHLEGEKIGNKWYVTLAGLQARANVWESIMLADAHGDD